MRGRALALAALGLGAALGATELGLRALGLGDPVLYDNREAYGFRPLPEQTRRRLFGARVHVNALGLRGPEVPRRRPPGVLRLLFLGDSVTWGGTYVDDADLFSARAAAEVAARLPGRFTAVEGLNAGVNAWGPQNVLGLVGEHGAFPDGFESDVWVVTVLEDDFRREKTRIGEVPYFNTPPATAWEELLVLAAYRLLGAYRVPKPGEDLERLARRNLEAYGALAARARAAGARALFVWHPARPAVGGAREPHKAVLLDIAARAGAATLDLVPAYAHAGGPALYTDGLHLARAGHAVAGNAIGAEVVDLLTDDVTADRAAPDARGSRTRDGSDGAGAGAARPRRGD